MKWVTAFLVIVATPLVVLAAAAVVPVRWLAISGAVFIAAGLVALLVTRRPAATQERRVDQSTVE